MENEKVTVSPEDREAAKSLLGRDDAGPSWWSIDSGNADNDPLVQAFALHREQSRADAIDALKLIRACLTRHEGEPSLLGDMYKVCDAALAKVGAA